MGGFEFGFDGVRGTSDAIPAQTSRIESKKPFINSISATNTTNPIETTRQIQEPTPTDWASLGLESVDLGKFVKYMEQPTNPALGSLSALHLAQVPQGYEDMANLLPSDVSAASKFYTDLAYVGPAGNRTEVGGENLALVADAFKGDAKYLEAFNLAIYESFAPSGQV